MSNSGLTLTACATTVDTADNQIDAAAEATEAEAQPDHQVRLLDAADLGAGWSTNTQADEPIDAMLNGWCHGPTLVRSNELADYVRYEQDAVVQHFVIDTTDAPNMADTFADAIDGCQGRTHEQGEVTSAAPVNRILDEAIPPTQVYRLNAVLGLLDLATRNVWAVTIVDDTTLSVVGVSTNDYGDDPPPDPFALLEQSLTAVHEQD